MVKKYTLRICVLLIIFSILAPYALAEIKKKKVVEDPKKMKKFVHQCAAGTEQFGEGPPYGSRVVCRQPLLKGKFRAEGSTVTWHANGKRKVEGEYARGDKHGIWTTYHRNGRVKWVETYYAGKRQTKTKFDKWGRPIEPPKDQQANGEPTKEEKKKKRISWRFMRK